MHFSLTMNPAGQTLSTIQTIAINRMESVLKRNALFFPSLIPSWVTLDLWFGFCCCFSFPPKQLMAFWIGVEGSSHFTLSTLFCVVLHSMCSHWVHWNGTDVSAPSLHLQGDFSMDQLQHNMMLVGQRVQIISTHLFSCDIPHPHPSAFSVHKSRVYEFAFKNMVCFSSAPVLLSDSYRKCAVTEQYVLKVILTGSKKQIISENIWSPAHMHISCQTRGSKWKQM